jgi:hypothetical protein
MAGPRWIAYRTNLTSRAQALRRDPTPAEKKLWFEFLRDLPQNSPVRNRSASTSPTSTALAGGWSSKSTAIVITRTVRNAMTRCEPTLWKRAAFA